MTRSAGGYERIMDVVHAARSAIRRGEILTGLCFTVLVAGIDVVALAALDNLFRLPVGVRVALLLAAAAAAGIAFVLGVVRPASRRMADDLVAVKIEEAAGGMDNSLINALQLGREHDGDELSGAFVRSVVEKGALTAGRFSPSRVVDMGKVGLALGLGGGALALVLLYALLLPRYFGNAVQRYTSLGAFVPPVSSTDLTIVPGDAVVLRGEPLTVSATASGTLVSSARILVKTGEEFEPTEMLFDGRAFSLRFGSVDEAFEYRVEAGGASSPVFRVALAERPGIERLELTYRFPDYLGLPERTDRAASGEIRAPTGTRVKVTAVLSAPVVDAALSFAKASPKTMARAGETAVTGEILVAESDTWSVVLRSADGLGNANPVQHRIVALPDEPPLVTITAPGKDVSVTLPARIPMTIRARDDHGLARLSIVARRGDGGGFRTIRTFDLTGETDRVVTHDLVLGADELVPGDVLTYRAEAGDHYPFKERLGKSRTFSIRVKSREDKTEEAEGALADLATRLRDLLSKENGIRRDTADLKQSVLGGGITMKGLGPRASSLGESQGRLGAEMVEVAGTVPQDVPALAPVRGSLLSLSVNEVMTAVRCIQDSRSRGGPTEAGRDLAAAEDAEREIIAVLEALLGRLEALLTRLKENPDSWIDEKMDEADPEKALTDALAKLKKFIRQQEEVLRQTRELEKKDVDDFTDEDLALLEKLAAEESELSRFLEDLKDDLSKVPDQDFSTSTVLKELIEAYSEVELAADALTKKDVELAVPKEQSGLELAESLTENLEKWLPDVRDNLKWNMEEFDGEYPEVPMTDLPDQLEDLIGELIEEEEQLGEDADDVTSGWADSLDKGAGWGVMDGPISNMSAQGKTGNTLPNSSEIGGRSGEGRTGRSHGEMVEGEATGKGGRKTPTRLTPDPWEGKAVKDSSTDPLGGATGGGKLAGGAGEGLAGPLPPEVKGDLGRLAGNQVALRQRAEQLDRALKKLHYPDENLERSVVLMKELEEALAKGDMARFSQRHGILVDQMKEGQARILEHSRVVRDRSRAVPKEIMREVESVDLSTLPEGYREMLREYYKILSRGGAK